MSTFAITGKNLTLDILRDVAHKKTKVTLAPVAKKHMIQSLECVHRWTKNGKIIYGLNTGFGRLSDVRIDNGKNKTLQLNLIRSHACGVGSALSEPEVRAVILLRAQVLARGYSGVRPLIVEMLLKLLNKNIVPVIPQKGSVGASGDLAPLAHLALVLVGEGEVFYASQRMPSQKAFRLAKISPIELLGREGLSLINGTQVMTALSAHTILRTRRLLTLFDVASALSLEASLGSRSPFHPAIHKLRPHEGQKIVAKNMWNLTQNSKIQKSHAECHKIQDSYSFRCIPQVHGSSREAWAFAKKCVETELNSVTDNPLIFSDENLCLSGGNFHGQILSQAMDFLSIALATLVNISERRIEKLLDPSFSGLSAFLATKEGLESGLMLAHVTAAALASQNKVLAHPASVDTIPTSGNKEDHVSMGVHAALKAHEILDNAENVLAIEFLAASQGLELRRPLMTSPILEKVMSLIRSKIPPITQDRIFSKDIETLKTLFPDIFSCVQGRVQ